MTGSAGDAGQPPTGGGNPVAPTCYRHPDRETYIRCARCNRPICPDCMLAAPVGFQCPECVAEGNKGVRQPRTALGGEVRERGNVLTLSLIVINVVVWLIGLVYRSGGDSLYAQLASLTGTNEIAARLGLMMGTTADSPSIGVIDGQWYRLLSAAFLHEQIFHIGLNMLALWMLGNSLEPVLGRWRFIALYLLSALGGSAASLLAMTESVPYAMSLGASGAVYGLFGALFVIMRKLGREIGSIAGLLAVNLVISFVVQGIDWRAHLGGLVVGTALAAVFAYAPRKQRLVWGIAGCVLALAAIVIAVLAKVG